MMVANMDGLNEIVDSLDSFNEAFASYLYVMKMNTLCVEWPEVRLAFLQVHTLVFNSIEYRLRRLPHSLTESNNVTSNTSWPCLKY